MTKKERAEIQECLRLIFEEERDTEAYLRLARMVGMVYPAGEAMEKLKNIDAREVIRYFDRSGIGSQPFKAPGVNP